MASPNPMRIASGLGRAAYGSGWETLMKREYELEIKETVIDLVRGCYSGKTIMQMNGIDRRNVAEQMAGQLDGTVVDEVLDYLEYLLPKVYLAALSGWAGDPEARKIDPWLNKHLTQWSFQSEAAIAALGCESRPYADPREISKWAHSSMEQFQSPERKDRS